jgi:1-aminocyclopropane-1-carboxylate deaminase
VSIGGVQSNHTRQVADVAARIGLRAAVVQESWVELVRQARAHLGRVGG